MGQLKKIAVLKIGSKSIACQDGRIRKLFLEHIARDVELAKADGWSIAIVSSGAVVCGKNDLLLSGKETTDQIYSMVGQRHLLNHWSEAFQKSGLVIGQGLYTNRMLVSLPERKESIREGLLECFRVGIVPILNENDAAVLDELKELMNEGDNDRFGSLVACLLDAALMVFLTTVPGLYDKDGKTLIRRISASDKGLAESLSSWEGQSQGGMVSKIHWGQFFVRKTKGEAYIKHYSEEFPLSRSIKGFNSGTLIHY